MLLAVFLLGSTLLGQARAPDPPEVKALEQQMFHLINIERKGRGLPPFVEDKALAGVARRHSQVMVALGKFSHDAGGSRFDERIRGGVKGACRFGENITKHYRVEYAVADLMGSAGHRANLLNPDFTAIGIGIARDGEGLLYITQDFVRFCEQRNRPRRSQPHR